DDEFAARADPLPVGASLLRLAEGIELKAHPALVDEASGLASIVARATASGELMLVAARLLREGGFPHRALELATEFEGAQPSYFSAVAAANAHRVLGRLEEALSCFRKASERKPEEEPCRLEIADLLLDLGRADEARAAYEDTLGRVPNHPWA